MPRIKITTSLIQFESETAHTWTSDSTYELISRVAKAHLKIVEAQNKYQKNNP